ncbi:unnamed protein product [Boreogadus saida]
MARLSSRSEKTAQCADLVSDRKNDRVLSSGLPPPPPIPMSPIIEKMEGLKSINNRSNSLRLGRLALYCHLEKVETMRCFWELKHVELEGGDQQGCFVGVSLGGMRPGGNVLFLPGLFFDSASWRCPVTVVCETHYQGTAGSKW